MTSDFTLIPDVCITQAKMISCERKYNCNQYFKKTNSQGQDTKMYNRFIEDSVLATSKRHSEDCILQQNTINNNNNHVLLASNASNLLHINTTSANGITLVDNLLHQTNDNIKPKKVTVKKSIFQITYPIVTKNLSPENQGIKNKAYELSHHKHSELTHLLYLTKHHLQQIQLDPTYIENHVLGAKYCRQTIQKGCVCIVVHKVYNALP